MLKIYAKTDIGLVRHSNQDCVETGAFSETAGWAVVCDGMGGANGGNIASQMAVEKIAGQISASDWQSATDSSIKNLLISAIYNANVAIFDISRTEESLAGMGTTVVAVVVINGVAHIAHAGDSRAYYITADAIRQLTTDHSVVQELVDSGDITIQQAQRHPQKNIITRALGVESGIRIDYQKFELARNSVLLLCTDGLTNYVEDAQIHALVREKEARTLPNDLIEAAKSGGGGDNVTIAIFRN